MELKLCRYCMEEVIKTERGIRYHRTGREGDRQRDRDRDRVRQTQRQKHRHNKYRE